MEVVSGGHLPMCSKGCLEKALKLGAFPGTHEPSREEDKENLSMLHHCAPSMVPPGSTSGPCVICELHC